MESGRQLLKLRVTVKDFFLFLRCMFPACEASLREGWEAHDSCRGSLGKPGPERLRRDRQLGGITQKARPSHLDLLYSLKHLVPGRYVLGIC